MPPKQCCCLNFFPLQNNKMKGKNLICQKVIYKAPVDLQTQAIVLNCVQKTLL